MEASELVKVYWMEQVEAPGLVKAYWMEQAGVPSYEWLLRLGSMGREEM